MVSFTKIIKRNGSQVPFAPAKITQAILKAGCATGEFDQRVAEGLTLQVLGRARIKLDSEIPTVEAFQDLVVEVLLDSPYKKTAAAYIVYRDKHARLREIVFRAKIDLIDDYLERLDWRVSENSNMSYSLQGLNHYLSSEISKIYWTEKIYSPEIGEAHVNGDIHIHDLNQLSVYCVGWDLQAILHFGFCGVAGKMESRPPKHFRSALGQIVNFFYTLQGEAAGAQALSNFDTLLAPFIRYDHLNYDEVKQAMQEFIFNMNVPTRVGFQTPFTNVTLDLRPPKMFCDTPVVVNGQVQAETYGEFQAEMDLFNRAFLEVMGEGDAKGRVFTFPIPTYNITKDFPWDDPNLDTLWHVTAKYGVPYFANFVNSDMNPDDARSMCCRLRLDLRHLEKRGGGLFGANPLTGSIGVVTINLARIGYLANDAADFFSHLSHLMTLSKDSLEIKRKILERLTDRNLYPYSKFYLKGIKDRFGAYWENHFSTIGIVAMNEACLNFLGVSISDPKGHVFAMEILDFMRAKLLDFQKETGHYYNLEATPAEGAAYRLARIDKKKFPALICANESDYKKGAKPFYTNSTHLPVHATDDIFEALDHQEPLQSRYTGGTVFHGFLGEKMPTGEATKKLVKVVSERYHLPYFTVTPTFSVCPTHGYVSGEHFECPKCAVELESKAQKCEVYSRVVGYLRPVEQWNEGKREEFKWRKEYERVDQLAPTLSS